MEERERIVIPDEDGNEHLFDELFKVTIDETGKSYIFVIPVGQDEEDEEAIEVYAFRYEEDEDNPESDIALFPIETDEEWEMVEEILNTFEEGKLSEEE